MENEKRTAMVSQERKILGIPPLIFLMLVLLLGGLAWYVTGYASENNQLIKKYEAAQVKLLALSRLSDKVDRKAKVCNSKLVTYEEANHEITLKLGKAERTNSILQKEKDIYNSQLAKAQQFYISVKEVLSLQNQNVGQDGDISDSAYEEVKKALTDLKEQKDSMVADKDKCDQLKTQYNNLNANVNKQQQNYQELQKDNEALKHQVEGLTNMKTELEEKIDAFETAHNKRGFLQKKLAPYQNNVQQIDLNKQKHEKKINVANTPKGDVNTQQGVIAQQESANAQKGGDVNVQIVGGNSHHDQESANAQQGGVVNAQQGGVVNAQQGGSNAQQGGVNTQKEGSNVSQQGSNALQQSVLPTVASVKTTAKSPQTEKVVDTTQAANDIAKTTVAPVNNAGETNNKIEQKPVKKVDEKTTPSVVNLNVNRDDLSNEKKITHESKNEVEKEEKEVTAVRSHENETSKDDDETSKDDEDFDEN